MFLPLYRQNLPFGSVNNRSCLWKVTTDRPFDVQSWSEVEVWMFSCCLPLTLYEQAVPPPGVTSNSLPAGVWRESVESGRVYWPETWVLLMHNHPGCRIDTGLGVKGEHLDLQDKENSLYPGSASGRSREKQWSHGVPRPCRDQTVSCPCLGLLHWLFSLYCSLPLYCRALGPPDAGGHWCPTGPRKGVPGNLFLSA